MSIDPSRFPRLAAVQSPADLRRLPEAELPAVAAELRGYLVETLARISAPVLRACM